MNSRKASVRSRCDLCELTVARMPDTCTCDLRRRVRCRRRRRVRTESVGFGSIFRRLVRASSDFKHLRRNSNSSRSSSGTRKPVVVSSVSSSKSQSSIISPSDRLMLDMEPSSNGIPSTSQSRRILESSGSYGRSSRAGSFVFRDLSSAEKKWIRFYSVHR